jgi:DNA-binding phage protein
MTMEKEPIDPVGSSFADFLEEEGLREEAHAVAIKRVLSWQLERERAARKVSKVEMARRMDTSRTQLERVLDPTGISVSLETMAKAADALGMRLRVELVEKGAEEKAGGEASCERGEQPPGPCP